MTTLSDAFNHRIRIPVIGSTIAAFASSYSLYLRWRDDRDRIVVGLGSGVAEVAPTDKMHVVNYGERKVLLEDYGFILLDGRLFSALIESELEPQAWGGKLRTELDPLETTDAGFDGYVVEIVGAYASIRGKGKRVLSFANNIRWWNRIRLRIKIALDH